MSGSWTSFIIDVVFVVVLGAMLIYGILVTWRRQRD